MPVTPRSFLIVPAKPRTPRSRTSPSGSPPARSRPGRRAAAIGPPNTTSCFASRKHSGQPAATPGARRSASSPRPPAEPRRHGVSMFRLVLLRHGESTWNKENRFTGWTDVDLTEKGRAEAREAGRLMNEQHYEFDVAYTSVLKRAIRTLVIALDEMDMLWIPIHKSWRLNERHYGALTGLNKAETAAKHGEAQVNIWRRSYDIPPPPLGPEDPAHSSPDRRYAALRRDEVPLTESLKDRVARFLPYWHSAIAPDIKAGRHVLIAAHGNSLRALVKYLDNMSEQEITKLNIPTGVPLVYLLNEDLKPLQKFYLGEDRKSTRLNSSHSQISYAVFCLKKKKKK